MRVALASQSEFFRGIQQDGLGWVGEFRSNQKDDQPNTQVSYPPSHTGFDAEVGSFGMGWVGFQMGWVFETGEFIPSPTLPFSPESGVSHHAAQARG